MDSTRLVRVGAVLLGASLLITLVLAGSSPQSADGSGDLVVAAWFASACLTVGALMLVSGLVLRGLRPPVPQPPAEPGIDHYA